MSFKLNENYPTYSKMCEVMLKPFEIYTEQLHLHDHSQNAMKPEFIMKSVIPVVMAGIIAIYGLVVAVLIAGNIDKDQYSLYK